MTQMTGTRPIVTLAPVGYSILENRGEGTWQVMVETPEGEVWRTFTERGQAEEWIEFVALFVDL